MHLADRRFVRSDGIEVTLSPTEWRLIEVLVQHAGHLVTREELLASVWGPQAASKTQYLRVHMASIRQKVEPDPSRPRYFVTIPGLGLRFESDGGPASGDADAAHADRLRVRGSAAAQGTRSESDPGHKKRVRTDDRPGIRAYNRMWASCRRAAPKGVPMLGSSSDLAFWESPASEPVVQATAAQLVAMFELDACWYEPFPFDTQLPRLELGRIVLPADEPGVRSWAPGMGIELPVRYRDLVLGRFVLVPAGLTVGVGLPPVGRAEAISMANRVGALLAAGMLAAEDAPTSSRRRGDIVRRFRRTHRREEGHRS